MGTPRATYVPQPSSSAARLPRDDRNGQLAAVSIPVAGLLFFPADHVQRHSSLDHLSLNEQNTTLLFAVQSVHG
jgi:hypothetical protein